MHWAHLFQFGLKTSRLGSLRHGEHLRQISQPQISTIIGLLPQ